MPAMSLKTWLLIFPLQMLRFLLKQVYPFTLKPIDRKLAKRNYTRLKQDVLDSFLFLSIQDWNIERPDLERAIGLGYGFAQVDVLMPAFRLTIRRYRGEDELLISPAWVSAEGDDLADLLSLCDSPNEAVRAPFADLRQASARLEEKLERVVELLSVENYPSTRRSLGRWVESPVRATTRSEWKVCRNIYWATVTIDPPPFGHPFPLREVAKFQCVSVVIRGEYKDCRLLLRESGVTHIAAGIPFEVWVVFLDPATEPEFIPGLTFPLWGGRIIGHVEPSGVVTTKWFGESS
jgi:hypothetical protein